MRMQDEAPDIRPLSQRLTEIAFPEADAVAARAIARYRSEGRDRTGRGRGGSRRRRLLPAAAVAAALVIAVLVATPAGPALAGSPLVNPIVARLLQIMGLSASDHGVVPLAVSSESAGHTVGLVAGFADSSRTVLVVNVSPGGERRHVEPDLAALTDASGAVIAGGGSIPGPGVTALNFGPLPHPVARGNALTLHITSLIDYDAGKGQDRKFPTIAGDWTLHFTLPYDDDAMAAPAPGDLGPVHVTVTGVAASGSSIHLQFSTDGATLSQLFEVAPAPGGQPFEYRLYDPNGRVVRALVSGNPAGKGTLEAERSPHVEWDLLYAKHGTGTYRLVMTWDNHRLERDLQIG